MTTKQHLIEQLRALCKANGGPDTVAEKAKLSSENLKQILAGTRLKSGAPRGIGPKIQHALDAAYPGWSGIGSEATSTLDDIETAIKVIGRALLTASNATRLAAAGFLTALAESPGEAADIGAQFRAMLHAAKPLVA